MMESWKSHETRAKTIETSRISRQSLWTQILYCLQPRIDFLAQTSFSVAGPALQRFDAALLDAAGAAAGERLADLDVDMLRRLALPARLYGCGLCKL